MGRPNTPRRRDALAKIFGTRTIFLRADKQHLTKIFGTQHRTIFLRVDKQHLTGTLSRSARPTRHTMPTRAASSRSATKSRRASTRAPTTGRAVSRRSTPTARSTSITTTATRRGARAQNTEHAARRAPNTRPLRSSVEISAAVVGNPRGRLAGPPQGRQGRAEADVARRRGAGLIYFYVIRGDLLAPKGSAPQWSRQLV